MKNLSEWQQFFKEGNLSYRQGVNINCSIFGLLDGELKILLVKRRILSEWQLPFGPVRKNEGLEEAAERTSQNHTGVSNLFIKQFNTQDMGTFVPQSELLNYISEIAGISIEKENPVFGGRICVGFYVISDVLNSSPEPDILSSDCRWFSVNDLPELNGDDQQMLREALINLRIDVYHFPVIKCLLGDKFTLKEIKNLYENMSGKKLNPTNFTNKLISLGMIIKLDEKKPIGNHRSPNYYKFDENIYKAALEKGLVLV